MDSERLQALLRPAVRAMDAYTPIYPLDVLSARLGIPIEQLVKLDANENPYGPAPRARAALAASPYAHIYPDPAATALRAALAEYVGLPAEHILCGSGADELLDLVVRAFVDPGQTLVNCPPTFGMYPFLGALAAARVQDVWRAEDFGVDVAAVARAVADASAARVLIVTSPNNPDGGVLADDDLRQLLALPLIVVLDEAYIEFAGVGTSRAAWVLAHPNLIVLRTFSKWAGLAGLRIGYGIFPLWMTPELWKIKQPYNVNVAASDAACASLADLPWLQANVARLVDERARLFDVLAACPFLVPVPSHANFILCRVVGRTALGVKRALEQQGILVRYFDKPGLQNCIRVSVGKPEHTARLAAALQALAQSAGEA